MPDLPWILKLCGFYTGNLVWVDAREVMKVEPVMLHFGNKDYPVVRVWEKPNICLMVSGSFDLINAAIDMGKQAWCAG